MEYTIILDLDGTLLNENSQISETTKNYLNTLAGNHRIILATGRPYSGSIAFYEQLNLDTPLITDNGGNIWYPNGAGFTNLSYGISVDTAKLLFNESKEYLRSAFFVAGKDTYAYKKHPGLLKIFHVMTTDNIIDCQLDEITVEPTGFIYLIDANFKEQFESFINTQLGDKVAFRFWGSDSKNAIYEIYVKGISKLSAVNKIVSDLNLCGNNVIAFGDGLNDIEMISGVSLGVAMKNANHTLKEVAKQITEFDHSEDGVIIHLRQILNKE